MAYRYWCTAILATALLGACRGDDPAAADAPTPPGSNIIALDSAQMLAGGIRVGRVESLPPDTIYLTGNVTFDAARISHVGPRTQGRVRRVAVEVGSHVTAGDTLAVLDSPELGSAQSRWIRAGVARDLAARNHERTVRLFTDGIVSERRRLEVEAELRDREAELAAARQALSALGAEPDRSGSGLFVLRAPLTGEVVEKHATIGEVLGPEDTPFVVGELNRVWLLLDLYEADLARVQVGAGARVIADAAPARVFDARVGLINSVVDSVSRTIKVRVEVPNPDHVLKPGMFARAGIRVAAPPGAVGIPHTAVQSMEGREVVFLPVAPGRFRAQPVVVGPPRAGGWVEVREGLALGDSIVVAGSFTLKAHQLRSTFGEEE